MEQAFRENQTSVSKVASILKSNPKYRRKLLEKVLPLLPAVWSSTFMLPFNPLP